MIALVLLAGAVGAVLRFLAGRAFASRSRFPWAVLLVNVVGSAMGGAVLGLAERGEIGSDVRLVMLTGLCGGLTTFSTWSVESVQLVIDGRWRTALLSVMGNLVVGVGVAVAGYAIVTLA